MPIWRLGMRSERPTLLKRLQQRLCFLQIARVEPFSEPPVNRSEQFARLPHLMSARLWTIPKKQHKGDGVALLFAAVDWLEPNRRLAIEKPAALTSAFACQLAQVHGRYVG